MSKPHSKATVTPAKKKKSETEELVKRFEKAKKKEVYNNQLACCPDAATDQDEESWILGDGEKSEKNKNRLQQWSTGDGQTHFPMAYSVSKVPSGLYEILVEPNRGIFFQKVNYDTTTIINFPDTIFEDVVNSIGTFWEREEIYLKNGIKFKRGILLWGPPGSGKTSLIKLLIKDIIEREGVVFKFTRPEIFSDGLRIFREIEPNRPVVAIMEDLDSYFEQYNESSIINILDGVDSIEKVVFIATTNYPEKLGERVINRPSRFDRRYMIDTPSEPARLMYFEHLFSQSPTHNADEIDLDKWVADTDDMSIAHLKELFTGTIILGDEYDDVLDKLKQMIEIQPSADDTKSGCGFTLT